MSQDHIKIAENYLEDFRIQDEQYIIGVHQPGITIHKQQKRALNLFYSLWQTGRIKKGSNIAVVGAGIAGLTLTSAAMKALCKVTLYEKNKFLVPNQLNCTDREIHPNIYDYPDDNSNVDHTALPVLNWRVGKVNLFWESVDSQFKEYQKELTSVGINVPHHLDVQLGKTVKSVHYIKNQKKYTVITDAGPGDSDEFYDVVVYAVGYGLESSDNPDNPIYWSNWTINQANIKDRDFLISGTGDGALMDVIQLALVDKDYKDLTNAIQNGKNGEELINELYKIRKNFFKTTSPSESYIYDAFKHISPKQYEHVAKNLNYTNYNITLNGQFAFKDCLNLDKVSLLNAFIVFILEKEKKIVFKEGDLNYVKTPYHCSIKGHDEDYTDSKFLVVMRHGTSIFKGLERITGLSDAYQASEAFKRQGKQSKEGIVNPIWTESFFEALFSDTLYYLIDSTAGHALPALETYSTIIKESIMQALDDRKVKADFKISVHKIVKDSSMFRGMQMTHFVGSREGQSNKGFGRMYKVTEGMVGYAIQTGEPCIIANNGNKVKFSAYLKHFNLENPEIIAESDRRSFFCLPINVSESQAVKQAPCFILLMDADQTDFFDRKYVLDSILAATRGLIFALEKNISRKNLEMDEMSWQNFEWSKTYNLSGIQVEKDFFNTKRAGFKRLMSIWNDRKEYPKYTLKKYLSFSNINPLN